MSYVLKWTVPVDDQVHEIGGGPIVHISAPPSCIDEVLVWTEEQPPPYRVDPRKVQIVGTGQSFNEFANVLGSVVVADGNRAHHVIGWP